MTKLRLLDLYCGAGGCAWGYHVAGFEVTGVDIKPMPHYPFEAIEGDALEYLAEHGSEYDVIHASPPCQDYSHVKSLTTKTYPRLIEPTREALISLGKPYIIENVPGSPLVDPIELCGAMFNLRTYRHRLFESNVAISAPGHPAHRRPNAKLGSKPLPHEMMYVVGNCGSMGEARKAMGISWMTRSELVEAVPPRYTHYIGRQLVEALK